MNQPMHTYRSFAAPAAVALVAGGLLALPQDDTIADGLVDQADPSKVIRASSTPGDGDLITNGAALWVDTANNRVGINKPSPDTNLHVYGTFRVWSNRKLTDSLAQGAIQMCDITYSSGWSADPTGFQSYGGALELNPRGLNPVEVNNALRVMPNGFVGLGVENPAVPFDMQGAFRTNDTIVSTKAAGAPFQIASSDLSANLNADLLDGFDADDFVLESELEALLDGLTASSGSSSGGSHAGTSSGGSRAMAGDEDYDAGLLDGSAGIVFPDGTIQRTAASGLTTRTDAIGSLTLNADGETLSSSLSDVSITVARPAAVLELAGDSSTGPMGSYVIRVTKPLDEMSLLMMGRMGNWSEFEQGQTVHEPVDEFAVTLAGLRSSSSSSPGVTFRFQEAIIASVEQNLARTGSSVSTDGGQFGLVQDVVLVAPRLSIELDGGVLEFNLDQGGEWKSDHPDYYLEQGDLDALRSIQWRGDSSQRHLATNDVAGLSLASAAAVGPQLVLRYFDPVLFDAAVSVLGLSLGGEGLLQSLASATVHVPLAEDPSAPVVEMTLEQAWVEEWTLEAKHGGGFDVRCSLYGRDQTWIIPTADGELTATWGGGKPFSYSK